MNNHRSVRFKVYVDVNYMFSKISITLAIPAIFLLASAIFSWWDFVEMVLGLMIIILFIALILLAMMLDFDYVIVADSEIRYKWFGGEKSISMKNILTIVQAGEVGYFSSLFRSACVMYGGYILFILPFVLMLIHSFLISSIVTRIEAFQVIVFIVIITVCLFVTLLIPANIGRRIFVGFYMGYFGAISSLLIWLFSRLFPPLVFMFLGFIPFFIVGFMFPNKLMRSDMLVIKAKRNGKIITLLLSGKKQEIARLKKQILEALSNVEASK